MQISPKALTAGEPRLLSYHVALLASALPLSLPRDLMAPGCRSIMDVLLEELARQAASSIWGGKYLSTLINVLFLSVHFKLFFLYRSNSISGGGRHTFLSLYLPKK